MSSGARVGRGLFIEVGLAVEVGLLADCTVDAEGGNALESKDPITITIKTINPNNNLILRSKRKNPIYTQF